MKFYAGTSKIKSAPEIQWKQRRPEWSESSKKLAFKPNFRFASDFIIHSIVTDNLTFPNECARRHRRCTLCFGLGVELQVKCFPLKTSECTVSFVLTKNLVKAAESTWALGKVAVNWLPTGLIKPIGQGMQPPRLNWWNLFYLSLSQAFK